VKLSPIFYSFGMKNKQIHLYVSERFYDAIKDRASKYGLSITMYVKYVLINDLKTPMYEISSSKKDVDE
jgi:predicted DNA binding CopG/RHH family protein